MTDDTDDTGLTPSGVVQAQVEAYNAGDIEGFLDCYDEDAEIVRLEDAEVIAHGHEEIRAQYAELFEAFPDLHCDVPEEFTVGEWVVSREHITGMGEEGPMDALAVYNVVGGEIRRLWIGGE